MRSVNQVTLLGNLVRDAEQKHTGSGKAVASLTVATNRRVKKGEQWEDEVEYHRVTLWKSENLVTYLTKGKPVYIEGRLQTRKYEKDGVTQYSTDIVAEDLILLGGGGEKREPGPVSAPRSAKSQPAPATPTGSADDFDSVPF